MLSKLGRPAGRQLLRHGVPTRSALAACSSSSILSEQRQRGFQVRESASGHNFVQQQSRAFSSSSSNNDKSTNAVAKQHNTKGSPVKMTNSEAFVESLVAHGVKDVFGIVGSAFMDPLDLFPAAGIRFISVQHEQNAAHMADGYARLSGKHGVVIGQNGPGVTNCVTGIGAAYWAHTPVVMITPECGSMGKGLGGFQEADCMEIFGSVVKDQFHVNNPARMAEMTERAFDSAITECGPTQLNIPRDYFYGANEFAIHGPKKIELSAGGPTSLEAAFQALKTAKNPVIISGGGVTLADGVSDCVALAEHLGIGACTTYLHNDSFTGSHALSLGPLGYLGSQAAMHALKEADVVLAVGTRLNPFGTNPQYGMDYWPADATLIQVERDPKRLGLTKRAEVEVCGDARLFLQEMLKRCKAEEGSVACLADKDARLAKIASHKANWEQERTNLTEATLEIHDEGPNSREGAMKPRQAIREVAKVIPSNAVVATDIGNSCSVAHGYLDFEEPRTFLAPMTFGNCGYSSPAAMGAKVADPSRPCIAMCGEGAWGMQMMDTLTCVRENIPITVVVFNNGQWGAEKKNQVLWFGDRYIGTDLQSPSFADIAKSMGVEGVKITDLDQVGSAVDAAVKAQMQDGKTTVIELITTRELGDPFRRDAMKLPQRMLDKYKHTDRFEESATQQPVNPRFDQK